MVSILDLARPEPSEDEFEHVHAAERMTILDHAIMAFYIVIVVMGWIGIGMMIATLFPLAPLASLVVVAAWPMALVPLILLITEAIVPLWRFMQRNAEHIDGFYND